MLYQIKRISLTLVLIAIIISILHISSAFSLDAANTALFCQNPKTEIVEGGVWRLTVELLDTIFVPYQPIWATISITNVSNETQLAPELCDGCRYLEYKVFDAFGNAIPQYRIESNRAFLNEDSIYLHLAPGKHTGRYLQLLSVLLPQNWHVEKLPNLKPGDYSLHVSIDTVVPKLKPHNKPKLVCNPITFKVVEPHGANEGAYELYKSALTAFKENHTLARERFERIISEYPYTPYDEMAHQHLIGLADSFFPEDLQNNILRLRKSYLLRFPQMPINILGNITYIAEQVSPSEFRDLCHQIAGNPHATRSLDRIKGKFPWALEDEDK